MNSREVIEKHLRWEPKGSTPCVWYDKLTMFGPLYLQQTKCHSCHPSTDIDAILNEEGWDYVTMRDFILSTIVEFVRLNMNFVRELIMEIDVGGLRLVMVNFSQKCLGSY